MMQLRFLPGCRQSFQRCRRLCLCGMPSGRAPVRGFDSRQATVPTKGLELASNEALRQKCVQTHHKLCVMDCPVRTAPSGSRRTATAALSDAGYRFGMTSAKTCRSPRLPMRSSRRPPQRQAEGNPRPRATRRAPRATRATRHERGEARVTSETRASHERGINEARARRGAAP
jgi:hypothetical protein